MTPNQTDPVRLPFPVQFDELPPCLVWIDTSRQDAQRLLGVPHQQKFVDGLGMTDFWAFEYSCGLQVVIQFCHIGVEAGYVTADSPERSHVVRHLPFPSAMCKTFDGVEFQKQLDQIRALRPERSAELSALQSFQVWRQGDDGNPFKIGEPTSERDARCHVTHYEALGHKQLYWYEAINP